MADSGSNGRKSDSNVHSIDNARAKRRLRVVGGGNSSPKKRSSKAFLMERPDSSSYGSATPDAAPNTAPRKHSAGKRSGNVFALRRYVQVKESPSIRAAMLTIPSWITPNGITLFRGALAVPAVLLLRSGQFADAVGVLILAFVLDFVDGALAHARGQTSRLGAFLDPLMDKILVCGALLALWSRTDTDVHVLVVAITVIAALITMVRIAKMASASIARRLPGVEAGNIGKLKFNVEVAAVFATILAVASEVKLVLSAAFLLLLTAAFLGLVSLFTQFVGHRSAD